MMKVRVRENGGFCSETEEPCHPVGRPHDGEKSRAAPETVTEEWRNSCSSHDFQGPQTMGTSSASCIGARRDRSLDYQASCVPARLPSFLRSVDTDDQCGMTDERVVECMGAVKPDRHYPVGASNTSRGKVSSEEHLNVAELNVIAKMKALAGSRLLHTSNQAVGNSLPEATLRLLTGSMNLPQDGCGQDTVGFHRRLGETRSGETQLCRQQVLNRCSDFTGEGPESFETAFRKAEVDFHLSGNTDGVDSTGSTRSEDSGCESPSSPPFIASAAATGSPKHSCAPLRSNSARGNDGAAMDSRSKKETVETDGAFWVNAKKRTYSRSPRNIQADNGRALPLRHNQEGKGRISGGATSADYYAMHKALPKVTGVRFQAQRNRFVAEWYDRGRTRMAYFPVKLYGFEHARNLAIRCREEVLQLKLAKRNSKGDDPSNIASARRENGCATLGSLEIDTPPLKCCRLDNNISTASVPSWRHTVFPKTSTPPFQSPFLCDVATSPAPPLKKCTDKETPASDVSLLRSLLAVDSEAVNNAMAAHSEPGYFSEDPCLPTLLQHRQGRLNSKRTQPPASGRAANAEVGEAILRELLKRVVAAAADGDQMQKTHGNGGALGSSSSTGKVSTAPLGFRSPLSPLDMAELFQPAPCDQTRTSDKDEPRSLPPEIVSSAECPSPAKCFPLWPDAQQSRILTSECGNQTDRARKQPVSSGLRPSDSSGLGRRLAARTSGGVCDQGEGLVEPSNYSQRLFEVRELEECGHQSGDGCEIVPAARSTAQDCGNRVDSGVFCTDDLRASESSNLSPSRTVDPCNAPDSTDVHEKKLAILKTAVSVIMNEVIERCTRGPPGGNLGTRTHGTSSLQRGGAVSGDARESGEEVRSVDKQHLLLNALREAMAAGHRPGGWPA